MRLIAKNKLEKLKRKNKGNILLSRAIEKLIEDIEQNDWKTQKEIKECRKDADCVHNDGFYFFNVAIHRTMILFEFTEYSEATVVWAGNHSEYESVFKNNKNTIRSWLSTNGWI